MDTIMFFLLLVLSFSIIILFNHFKPKNSKKTARLPPGPRGLPLFGILHEFDPINPHLYLHELAKKHGPLMWMKLGSRPAIVISSARVAKLALKDNDLAFAGRPALIGFQKYSYNGKDITFSGYNETWREMRKLSLIHLFSVKQVVSFLPVRKDEVSRMIEEMTKTSDLSELINLSRTAFFLTNRIICRAGFGKKYDEMGKKRFDKVFRETQVTGTAFYIGDYFPSLAWIDKLTGMHSRLEKNFRELDNFYQQLIDDHLDPNRPESMNGDILDLMLKLKQDQTAAVPVDWENIKGILMVCMTFRSTFIFSIYFPFDQNVFIAGTDTSASLIVWAMTALIKKPQAMKKVQEEVRNKVGNKGSVDEDDVQNLPYLKAIIKETLRMFPPTPLSVPREITQHCTIDGYDIPPKTMVYLNTHAIGLDPEYWENPTEFMPDRFLNSTIDYKGHDYGLLPFGSGRRGCPGINLGVATIELALANLLYSFEWELPDGVKAEDIDMEVSPGVTINKKNDLCLVGKRYKYI
ncbi:cytochrome P450 83B1-like [Primulina eburnea]|uniref:cytochrome P450 83B1-like n=1 Tax=Primulina eburnea TaxID=1245227 RepID=UPI003C6BEA5D